MFRTIIGQTLPPARARPAALAIILLAGSIFLSACSGPGYYLQAVSGHLKLMKARQDIHVLIDNPATSAQLVSRLESSRQILAFAETTLDLPAHGSYASYVDLNREAVTWNVVATEAFSLQPKKYCFPVAGCLPYRGFFNLKKAEKSAEKLRNQTMDVFVWPATAYSTLGKQKDPLLSTMFTGSDVRLAAYLFHELAHQRVYLKGDGGFNENYASFVEQAGVQRWLESSGQQTELDHWFKLNRVEEDFNALISDVREQLASLYRSDLSEADMRRQKARIFLAFEDAYTLLVNGRWGGKKYYADWFDSPLNNARLALYNTYTGGNCAFANLMTRAGGNMPEFHRLVEIQAKLKKPERDKWLNQVCQVIASASNL